MKDFRFNYIITIHNKQDLIERVLEGVIACARENSFIYPVLDGCTDNTEAVVDEVIRRHPEVSITKVFTPDVNELRTINAGLKAADQSQRGFNIILQDDVVMEDLNLEDKVRRVYEFFGYEKVGYLSFRHAVNIFLRDQGEIAEMFRKKLPIVQERDLIESAYGMGMSAQILPPHHLVRRMVSVGSPQCISCFAVNKIGIMDEALAPGSWSCQDFSLRCLKAGMRNYAFAIKLQSRYEWGGSRTPKPWLPAVQYRNQHLLYNKHGEFISKFSKTEEYARLKTAKPFAIPGIPADPTEIRQATREYKNTRRKLAKWQNYIIDLYLKHPLKRVLIGLGLY